MLGPCRRITIGCNGEREQSFLTCLIARAFPLNRSVIRLGAHSILPVARIYMSSNPYVSPHSTRPLVSTTAGLSLRKIYTWGATACQVICGVILMFGDIGFDKPGKYGLDFGHALVLVGLSLLCLLTGLITACSIRSVRSACLLLGGAFVVVIGFMAS